MVDAGPDGSIIVFGRSLDATSACELARQIIGTVAATHGETPRMLPTIDALAAARLLLERFEGDPHDNAVQIASEALESGRMTRPGPLAIIVGAGNGWGTDGQLPKAGDP